MGRLFDAVAEEQLLVEAWQHVRDRALADGDAGPAVSRFERGVVSRLSRLAEELRTNRWRPHAVTAVEIPKRAGGTRTLGVPSVEDRVVERAVLQVLDPVIDPVLMPTSYGYRRGLGVNDALDALRDAYVSGFRHVLRSDFDECFSMLPRWGIVARLREVVDDSLLCGLIELLVFRPESGGRTPRKLGLAQGSALSPLLCNLYLDAFDRQMLTAGFATIRFADDFAIPVRDRFHAEAALVSNRAP